MHGHLEPLVSVIRIFQDGDEYGDKYTWCGTVKHIDSKTIEVVAVMRAPVLSELRAIKKTFREQGYKSIHITRIKNGKVCKHIMKL